MPHQPHVCTGLSKHKKVMPRLWEGVNRRPSCLDYDTEDGSGDGRG